MVDHIKPNKLPIQPHNNCFTRQKNLKGLAQSQYLLFHCSSLKTEE
ncbi:hypothetical protein OIU84_021353 [Salix udensis]|uniref:Uncharacterized protein n=1 Tax=Salix udensis TaxID=889485 RepID=A0AAD6KWZ5_9ROSI|nr:hypothetical protein OIU84_021353 [Salix udensis]